MQGKYISGVIIGNVPNVERNYLFAFACICMLPIKKFQIFIVFHDSLLSCYQGFNTIVSALINDDFELGFTCLRSEVAFDTGAMINQYNLTIKYPIKVSDVIENWQRAKRSYLGKLTNRSAFFKADVDKYSWVDIG
jgi:methionyl-tRNA formyltransferase